MIRAPARAVAALLLVCTGWAPAFAQDLLQIWSAAVQRDPLYAAAQASRNADQERVPQARAQLMPWVTADTAAEIEDVRRTSNLGHAQTRRSGLWALTLTQPVIDIGRWGQLEQSQYIARTGDVSLAQARQ